MTEWITEPLVSVDSAGGFTEVDAAAQIRQFLPQQSAAIDFHTSWHQTMDAARYWRPAGKYQN